ncbi:MAG: Lpg1974 family pore-forming outer membrane protein [Parachlamydiales bacterium]
MLTIIPLLAYFNMFSVNPSPSDGNSQPAQTNISPSQTDSSFERGDKSLDSSTPEGYNYPASIKPNHSWHLITTASYIYWFAGEDGLDLATSAAYISGTNLVIPSKHEGKTIFQNFEYSSGFKVGLGFNLHPDNWVFKVDYTRLHLLNTKSESAPSAGNGIGALYLTDWFYQASPQGQGIAARHLSSKWHLELDWLDAVVERPMYSGRMLTLTPFIGLRTSWIEQSLNIRLKGALNVSPPSSTVHSHNHLNSWAIGPRAGLDAHFLLGAGFRLQGEVGASILYTRFTKVTHSEDPFVAGGIKVSYDMHNRPCVRPMVEANLGLGWGTYFSKKRCHFDLSATYDFNYLWSQNMMRTLNDVQIIGTSGGNTDLYLHGLTANMGFTF